MKRKIGLFALVLALTGVLAACGNNNASATPTAPAVAPTDSAKPSGTPTPRASDNIVGNADNAMRSAGNAARNAVDDMGDAARNAARGVENALDPAYNWNGTVPGSTGYAGYGNNWNVNNGTTYDGYAYTE